MNVQATVIIRQYQADTDAPFVFSTWRNSSFYGNTHSKSQAKRLDAQGMPKEWFRQKTQAIKAILDHALVCVACLSDDPGTIVGYSVSTGSHLNWVYVKADFRGQGIGNLLCPDYIRTVTSDLTKIGAAIVAAKGLETQEKNT